MEYADSSCLITPVATKYASFTVSIHTSSFVSNYHQQFAASERERNRPSKAKISITSGN